MSNKELISLKNAELLLSSQGTIITLWAIRENGPLPFAKLFDVMFRSRQDVRQTDETSALALMKATQLLARTAQRLLDAALIEVEGGELNEIANFANGGNFVSMMAARDKISLVVSPRLNIVQEIFSISLNDRLSDQDSQLMIKPSYGKPHEGNWPDVFVIMPFREELKAVYDDHILPVVRSLSLTCKRGDDFLSDEAIISEIWSAIFYSKLCIADCTGRNANVFYEIGIAHTLGRPCILLTQSVDDVPFDVRHRRMIVYEASENGLRKLRDTLTRAIEDELGLEHDKLKEILDKLE